MAALTEQFFVTGGDVKGAPRNALSPGLRGLNILAPYPISSIDQWSGQKVWLLIPGFTNTSDYLDPTVGAAINNANSNDAVLALDWTQVSGSPVGSGAGGVLTGDLYRSASWITPVATAVREKLFNWGMPASALNIIGNSLGTHLAGELAASFTIYGQVGSVTALDPASNGAKLMSPYDRTNGYDTDLTNGYVKIGGTPDPIKRLDIGATISRSFNGISSLAGNESQSGTAKESFLFDFGTNPDNRIAQLAQHGRVVTAYTNLVTTDVNGNSRLATNILGLNDTLADHQFRPDFYKGDFNISPQVHEGVIPVDAQDNPLFLVAAKLNGGVNDRFVYGTNSDDKFDSSLPFSLVVPFSKYYNNNGNHTYYLGDGNDTVFAGTGNDTIFGGAGNDYLDGGAGSNTIFGEDGNDIIFGGNGGINRLRGGLGNDTLYAGGINNSLRGSETNSLSIPEIDILNGNSSNSAFDLFWIGDGTTNWYSSALFNDYVEIRNFDPAIDTISGGVNIRAVNNPLTNQTFLGSGIDLIAKIDGLWVGNPNFQFPSI